jgi:hypothetical protein
MSEEFWRDLLRPLGLRESRCISRKLVDANRPIPDWVVARVDPDDPLGEHYDVGLRLCNCPAGSYDPGGVHTEDCPQA